MAVASDRMETITAEHGAKRASSERETKPLNGRGQHLLFSFFGWLFCNGFRLHCCSAIFVLTGKNIKPLDVCVCAERFLRVVFCEWSQSLEWKNFGLVFGRWDSRVWRQCASPPTQSAVPGPIDFPPKNKNQAGNLFSDVVCYTYITHLLLFAACTKTGHDNWLVSLLGLGAWTNVITAIFHSQWACDEL